jgi:3-hydroxyacyl-CoA dehydrogenase/enoyl-CoA hydratase/3-hydroxybutyryl-CoA epimerase
MRGPSFAGDRAVTPPPPKFDTLTLEVDDDGIAVIRMDLPRRSMNMTTPELTADLMRAFERVATDATIKGAILASGKERCFVAGGDIKDFAHAYERGMTREQAFALSHESSVFFRRIETCGKPVAAAINGLALGGGLELCLACHYRVIADDPKAIVGQPEVTIGLLPGGGATQRLPRLIGVEAALPLLLSGRHLQPAEALRLGVVHAMAPADQLLATARRWLLAHPDARQPWDQPGYVVPGGLACLAAYSDPAFVTDSGLLTEATLRHYPAPRAILSCVIEGMAVPIDAGLHIESRYFSTLLTGAVARNLMRTGFVNKGLVNKLAYRPPDVPKARIRKLGLLGDGLAELRLARAAAAAGIEVAERRRAGEDDRALDDCDLLLALPQAGTAQEYGGAGRVSAAWRDRFAGVHLASVGGQPGLLEIGAGADTSRIAVARAFDLAAQLKLTPVAVLGSPGCYSARVVTAYIDEGRCLLQQGWAAALIERAATMAGMVRGPLSVADADAMPVETHGDLIRLPPGQDDIGQRLLTIQVLEAARCVEQGVLGHVEADVGALAGWGFPAYTGGPLSFIDTLGIERFIIECERLATRYGVRFQPSRWLVARAGQGASFYGAGSSGADFTLQEVR